MAETVRFAVFGDVNGHQNLMFQKAKAYELKTNKPLDAILQVGDFETIRNYEDFEHYYAPARYHYVSDIADYVDGLKRTPVCTVFTGGNHEAWGVLKKSNHGGFICPDVYYLGRSGVIELKGVRIGGLTGVYSHELYKTPLPEMPNDTWKFYREEDILRLLEDRVDILLLHEWPKPIDSSFSIEWEKNVPAGLKHGKPTPAYHLVMELAPRYVFAGHMHRSAMRAKCAETSFVALRNSTQDHDSMFVFEISPASG